MNIPTKLITTTIDEFKAEGYTATKCIVDSNAMVGPNTNYQLVTLEFVKSEDTSEDK